MNSLRLFLFAGLCVLPSLVGAVELSGSVLGVDRKPLAGVQVRLVGGNALATTDALGAWRIEAQSTRIGPREVRRLDGPRAVVAVEDGRLRLRIAGRDLSGRGGSAQSFLACANLVAGRVQGVPDTLTYSLGGKVLLRDTVSASRTGIVRILDSTFNPAIVYGYLTDSRDGRTYRTVKIGSQVWMAENLNFKKGGGADSGRWYKGSPDSGAKYGRLYRWASLMNLPDSCNAKRCANQIADKHRGLCPEDWRVPSDEDWDSLMHGVGGSGTAATKLKSTRGWKDSGSGKDDHGFRALPGGYVYGDSIMGVGTDGGWWITTETREFLAQLRLMFAVGVGVDPSYLDKSYGFSARCFQGGTERYRPSDSTAVMKLIPAGTFTMGSPEAEANRLSNETQHSVTLRSFWMDITPVTHGQYQVMMGVNPSSNPSCDNTCPVDWVTWFDAVLYCNARSKREGLDTVYTYTAMTGTHLQGVRALAGIATDLSRNGYRLPTEAQWEYAARGGTTTTYYWGNDSRLDTLNRYAWHSGNTLATLKPAATKPANPFGLYDMAGNAMQWANDWYGTYDTTVKADPPGPSSGSSRVIRGGSWESSASSLRSARRSNSPPDLRSSGIGFRTARPAP